MIRQKIQFLIIFCFCFSLQSFQGFSQSDNPVEDCDLANITITQTYPRKLIADGEKWITSPEAKSLRNTGLGYLTMARGFSLMGEDDKAVIAIQQAISEFKESGQNESINEANLQWAEVLVSLGNLEGAAELYLNVMNSAEIQHDTIYLSLAYNGLGMIFRNFSELSKARQYFEIALRLGEKINHQRCISTSLKNLGTYFFYLNNYRKAYDYYNRAFQYWKDQPIHEDKCGLINNIANTLREREKYDLSKQKYFEAFQMANDLGSTYMHTVILKNLGTLALRKNNFPEAIAYFQHATNDAKQFKLGRIVQDILRQEAILYAKTGNYKLSYEKYTQYDFVRDSALTANQRQGITRTISNIEVGKEKQRIETLEESYKINKLKSTRTYLVFAVLLLSLIIVLIILVYNYLIKSRINKALENQRDEILCQKDEVVKLNALLQETSAKSESLVKERTYELNKTIEMLRDEFEERKKAVQSLHEYQEYLMSLLNSVADPVFVKDEDHKWVLLNDAACSIVGLPREQLIGKSDIDVFPEEEALVFWEKDDLVLSTGDENVNEESITTYQGETHIIETKKTLYVNKEGKRFIVGLITDVTEQRRLQQHILTLNQELEEKISQRTNQLQLLVRNLEKEIENRLKVEAELIENREKLDQLLENIPVGILHINRSGEIVLANKAILSILDISADSRLSNRYIADYPCFNVTRIPELLNRLIHHKEAFSIDSQPIITEKGRKIFVHCHGVAVSDKKEEYFTLVLADVTERKLIEDELLLEKEKAENANQLKNNFLSNMSHEFKTPLTGILGYAELLREESTDTQNLGMIDTIISSGKRLLSTMDAVLLLSRLQSGQIIPSIMPVNAANIIAEEIKAITEKASAKGLSLHVEAQQKSAMLADKVLFSEVLKQVLENAVKFTYSGEIKVIQADELRDNINGVKISIADTGIGIRDIYKEVIFDDFRQVSEGWGRAFEGNGLGLSIAKRIMELMNGKIWLETGHQKGAQFNIWLPVI